jgi:thiol-disulfide isomerase/thioredoxin
MLFKKNVYLLFICLLSFAGHSALASSIPAKDFLLFDIQSQAPIKLSHYYGKVIYLDFWASWCSSCAKALPLFKQWQQELGDDFIVISINVDEDKADGLAMTKRLKLTYPVGYDSTLEVAKMYGTSVLPYSFIIDKAGNIHYQHIGFQDKDAKKLEKTIINLLK